MIRTIAKQIVCVSLSFLLVLVTFPVELAAQAPPAGSSQPAPLSADELQQMVAPIAFYPDALVAQVLGAATFPDQVSYADNWLHQNQHLTGENPDEGRRCAALGPKRESAHAVPVRIGLP